jgi:hypothetical protein
MKDENRNSFQHERVLGESLLWITFLRIGENGLHSRVVGNSARKRKSTYFLGNSMDYDLLGLKGLRKDEKARTKVCKKLLTSLFAIGEELKINHRGRHWAKMRD